MLVCKSVQEFRKWRRTIDSKQKLGFVPTMGCLHSGHLSLVKEAKLAHNCDIVVVSVFVNPSQFAPTEDFDNYPRTEDDDISLLKSLNMVDVVLLPTVSDIYPSGITLNVEQQVGTFVNVQSSITRVLESKSRPHFFRGVTTIVAKLFNIVQPHVTVFGQKDIQQCTVVRQMISDLCFDIQFCMAPTLRDPDGLAMSSRNRYLNPKERSIAPAFYKSFLAAKALLESGNTSIKDLTDAVKNVLNQHPEIEIDYIAFSSPSTLLDIATTIGSEGAILSGAIRLGKTRLIDNIILENK
jgi:pantoate--beta-alanine ligase